VLVGAALLALLVSAGAGGAVGAYYLQHHDARAQSLDRDWRVVLQPLASGAYQVELPLPVDEHGDPARIALQASGGPVEFGVVRTEYGAALSVRGDGDAGPVVLVQHGGLPLRLSMDDARSTLAQFKFWARLAEGSPAVNVSMALGERTVSEDWQQVSRLGHTIVFSADLQPGWQRVRAEHDFDIYLAGGTGEGFPRLLIAGLATSLGAMYLPLGVVALRWRRA
jgi:hypothetical protein